MSACHIAPHFGTMVPTYEAGTTMKSLVVKRSVLLAGCKTSVSLEDEFWTALKEIAERPPRDVVGVGR